MISSTLGNVSILSTVLAPSNSQYKQSKLHCFFDGDKSIPNDIPNLLEGIGPKIIEFEYDKIKILLNKKREAI